LTACHKTISPTLKKNASVRKLHANNSLGLAHIKIWKRPNIFNQSNHIEMNLFVFYPSINLDLLVANGCIFKRRQAIHEFRILTNFGLTALLLCWSTILLGGPLSEAKRELEDARLSCAAEGQKLEVTGKSIILRDLGDSPEPEAIVDYLSIGCPNNSNLFCGTNGCPVHLIGQNGHTQYLTDSFKIVAFGNQWAVLFPMAASFCAKNDSKCCFRQVYLKNHGWIEEYKFDAEPLCSKN
jgi:hypothetical protein